MLLEHAGLGRAQPYSTHQRHIDALLRNSESMVYAFSQTWRTSKYEAITLITGYLAIGPFSPSTPARSEFTNGVIV